MLQILTGPLTTGHIGLNVTELSRSIDFYSRVFGLQVQHESRQPGREFGLLTDGQRLVLTLWQQADKAFDKTGAGLHHLSFEVESSDIVYRAESELKKLGATFLHDGVVAHSEGADSGGIFFADPDGNRLEIYAKSGIKGHPSATPHAPSCGFF